MMTIKNIFSRNEILQNKLIFSHFLAQSNQNTFIVLVNSSKDDKKLLFKSQELFQESLVTLMDDEKNSSKQSTGSQDGAKLRNGVRSSEVDQKKKALTDLADIQQKISSKTAKSKVVLWISIFMNIVFISVLIMTFFRGKVDIFT